MISQFFILSPRGDTVITRDYLGNVPKVNEPAAAAAGWPTRCIHHHVFCREAQKYFTEKSSFGMVMGRMHLQCFMLMVSTICT